MSGDGDSLEDEAKAIFNAYHGEIEPFSFKRVGSTGFTGGADEAREGEAGRGEKEMRLRVGLYSQKSFIE